jgi:LPS O-antigen subunit length determinant protein (WzzB/FepE family)
MPRKPADPARKAAPRLALYLFFAFVIGAILVFIWTGMHA